MKQSNKTICNIPSLYNTHNTAYQTCCQHNTCRNKTIFHSFAPYLSLILCYILGQIAAQVIGKVIADHEAMVKAEEERLRREEELAAEEAEKEKAEQENNEDNEAETL